MKLTLALLAGIAGLIVTASAVMLVWMVIQQQRSKSRPENEQAAGEGAEDRKLSEASEEKSPPLSAAASMLLQWTYFDYALIGVFVVGSLFLFTDVIAVIRDSASYPLYHYGYLLCGFVFTGLAMLFMVLRLAAVLSLVRSGRTVPAPDEHRHPGEADQAE